MKRNLITASLVFLASIASFNHRVRAASFGDDAAFLKSTPS